MSTVNDFTTALYRDLPAGAHGWHCFLRGNPRKAEPWQWSGTPLPAGRRPIAPDDANCYIVVSSFTGGKRRKAHFAALHALMVDDIGTKITQASIKLKLSAAVETSSKNWQGWYFLDKPLTDRTIAERLIDQMIAKGLAAKNDPGMSGVTRYGRLPAGVNGKHNPAFPCRLSLFEPNLRYSVDELAAAYGLDLAEPPPRRQETLPPRKSFRGDDLDVLELLHAANLYRGPRGGGAHEILCPWVDEHTDRGETGTAYFEPSSENNNHGGFCCHHGHCQHRSIGDLYRWLRTLVSLARRAA
jgi:hypothetical protein